jgi:hypothetical protein
VIEHRLVKPLDLRQPLAQRLCFGAELVSMAPRSNGIMVFFNDPVPCPDPAERAGVDLYFEKQAIDTTTLSGRMLFQMLGVFSEFERALIQERIHAGLVRAREKGTKSAQ